MKPVDVALMVVHRRGLLGREFLVALRSPEREGYWHLIGGAVEEGESTADAAVRELEEETGLAQTHLEEIPVSLGYDDTGDWVTIHVFSAEVPQDWEPRLDEEHVDYRWCSASDAVELLAYEEPREALREVARRIEVSA